MTCGSVEPSANALVALRSFPVHDLSICVIQFLNGCACMALKVTRSTCLRSSRETNGLTPSCDKKTNFGPCPRALEQRGAALDVAFPYAGYGIEVVSLVVSPNSCRGLLWTYASIACDALSCLEQYCLVTRYWCLGKASWTRRWRCIAKPWASQARE